MSSTNRTNAKERHISDYYVTPIDCIEDFFTHWLKDMADTEAFLSVARQSQNLIWLDPCAGGDKDHPMSYPKFIQDNIIQDGQGQIDTIDIREDSLAEIKADFLQIYFKQQYDVVITNPPFNIAIDIIKKSLEVVKDGGYVIMLLRLNFFGSKSRKHFWDNYMPIYTYVHNRRMSFTDGSGTDSIEYMHAVWQKGNYPAHTKLKVI